MTEDDIVSGFLVVNQGKTHKKLRIVVSGELAALLGRIATHKGAVSGSPSQFADEQPARPAHACGVAPAVQDRQDEGDCRESVPDSGDPQFLVLRLARQGCR
jgi:hypothetical protein